VAGRAPRRLFISQFASLTFQQHARLSSAQLVHDLLKRERDLAPDARRVPQVSVARLREEQG